MARPERNNVDYFPFYCEDGKKMFYLEETYGNDGFATFLKLLRELAKTDFHYLDLSKKTTQMFLSAKCKVSNETLIGIIDDLAELGKFNEMLWSESKVIWCQDFVDSIQDAYKKRNNKCITFDGLLLLLNSLGVRKQGLDTSKGSVKPQSKVEYTKVKENKDVRAEQFEIFWSFYPKKVAKANCKKKFMKLSDSDVKQISKTIRNYVAYKPFESYIHPHPETYFNQRRWEDEIPEQNQQIGINLNLAAN